MHTLYQIYQYISKHFLSESVDRILPKEKFPAFEKAREAFLACICLFMYQLKQMDLKTGKSTDSCDTDLTVLSSWSTDESLILLYDEKATYLEAFRDQTIEEAKQILFDSLGECISKANQSVEFLYLTKFSDNANKLLNGCNGINIQIELNQEGANQIDFIKLDASERKMLLDQIKKQANSEHGLPISITELNITPQSQALVAQCASFLRVSVIFE